MRDHLRLFLHIIGGQPMVFISDESGDVEEVDITPKNGKLGLSTELVELEDAE